MRLFFLLLFSLCLSGIASAQTTELTISGAFDFWQPQFHAGNYRFSKDNGFQHECLGAAVAAAVPVKNGFYLGAEAGIHSGSYFIDHTISAKQGTAEFSHLGYYEVNQFQVFLVPEYRFLKDDLLL